jgi:hypothetical protein
VSERPDDPDDREPLWAVRVGFLAAMGVPSPNVASIVAPPSGSLVRWHSGKLLIWYSGALLVRKSGTLVLGHSTP